MFELIRKAQKAKALNLRTTTAILPETIRDLKSVNRAILIQQEEERQVRIQEAIDQVASYNTFLKNDFSLENSSMNLHIDDSAHVQDINELVSLLEGSTLNDTRNSNNQEGSALFLDVHRKKMFLKLFFT